jgi:hypothetical protein
MCTSNITQLSGNLSPFDTPLGSSKLGKINKALDPGSAYVTKQVQQGLFPKREPVAPPPGVQDFKEPDLTLLAKARKDAARAGSGTLLTSPSGVANQTFGSTLLGG